VDNKNETEEDAIVMVLSAADQRNASSSRCFMYACEYPAVQPALETCAPSPVTGVGTVAAAAVGAATKAKGGMPGSIRGAVTDGQGLGSRWSKAHYKQGTVALFPGLGETIVAAGHSGRRVGLGNQRSVYDTKMGVTLQKLLGLPRPFDANACQNIRSNASEVGDVAMEASYCAVHCATFPAVGSLVLPYSYELTPLRESAEKKDVFQKLDGFCCTTPFKVLFVDSATEEEVVRQVTQLCQEQPRYLGFSFVTTTAPTAPTAPTAIATTAHHPSTPTSAVLIPVPVCLYDGDGLPLTAQPHSSSSSSSVVYAKCSTAAATPALRDAGTGTPPQSVPPSVPSSVPAPPEIGASCGDKDQSLSISVSASVSVTIPDSAFEPETVSVWATRKYYSLGGGFHGDTAAFDSSRFLEAFGNIIFAQLRLSKVIVWAGKLAIGSS
jgi:hypothetical protein